MAKRTNYGFEKRQKEAKRKKKQEEKLEKKRLRAAQNAAVAVVEGHSIDANAAPAIPAEEDAAAESSEEETRSE